MKILIIGNGFDLAHGLPTTYKNFLDFCERAKRIYTYGELVTWKEYEERSIKDWNVCESVKKKLLQPDTAGSKTDYRIHKEYYRAGNEFTRDSKVM